jgi:hypothetical protein
MRSSVFLKPSEGASATKEEEDSVLLNFSLLG